MLCPLIQTLPRVSPVVTKRDRSDLGLRIELERGAIKSRDALGISGGRPVKRGIGGILAAFHLPAGDHIAAGRLRRADQPFLGVEIIEAANVLEEFLAAKVGDENLQLMGSVRLGE
jgi:hypothetical protein